MQITNSVFLAHFREIHCDWGPRDPPWQAGLISQSDACQDRAIGEISRYAMAQPPQSAADGIAFSAALRYDKSTVSNIIARKNLC